MLSRFCFFAALALRSVASMQGKLSLSTPSLSSSSIVALSHAETSHVKSSTAEMCKIETRERGEPTDHGTKQSTTPSWAAAKDPPTRPRTQLLRLRTATLKSDSTRYTLYGPGRSVGRERNIERKEEGLLHHTVSRKSRVVRVGQERRQNPAQSVLGLLNYLC